MSDSTEEKDINSDSNSDSESEGFDVSKYQAFDKEFSKKFGVDYRGLGKGDQFEKVNFIPTDCLSINKMLGGGLPEGRIIECYGPASNGKTTLALHIIKSFQQQGKLCFFIDAEHAWNDEYAMQCGVDLDRLAKLAPSTANDALEAVRLAAQSGHISLILLDSVAALVPKEEFDKDVGGGMIGSLARLMSSALKQIAVLASQNKCTIIFLNQERAANIGGYGEKSATAGGNSLKYYTSVRIDINRTGYIEATGGEKIGIAVKAQTTKNKTSTPFKTAEYNILFPHEENGCIVAGIDTVGDIINLAVENDIIVKSGSWFAYKDIKTQGLEKLRKRIIEDSSLYDELYHSVLNVFDS